MKVSQLRPEGVHLQGERVVSARSASKAGDQPTATDFNLTEEEGPLGMPAEK